MIPLFEKFSNLLNRREQDRPRHQGRRLGVESLEDRCVMTATATGMVSGVAFVDFNSNLIHDAQEVVAPGIQATLTGKTTLGSAVSVSATTDSNGSYSFLNVQPGTYQLNYSPTSGSPGSLVSSFSVKGGQTVTRDIATPGVPLDLVSLNQYLSDSTLASGVLQPAGGGDGLASSRANDVPTLLASAVLSVSGVKNGSNVIDLAGTFTDPDITNSHVSFKTSAGSIDVQLFDKLAPKTVANFLNYVVSNRYDDAIFHRLGAFLHAPSTTKDVLQAGLFHFSTTNNQGSLTNITADPTIADEVNLPNTAGTLAMAKTTLPNSASDQFFFNLIDNTTPLSPAQQANGGFTVFGTIDPASQSVLTALASSNVQNKSSFDSTLTNLPLRAGAGAANFPTSTVASDYALIKDVVVVRRDESLTYSVVSNNKPSLVTASVVNNRLSLAYQPNQTGTANITIRATDQFGATKDATFTVVVA